MHSHTETHRGRGHGASARVLATLERRLSRRLTRHYRARNLAPMLALTCMSWVGSASAMSAAIRVEERLRSKLRRRRAGAPLVTLALVGCIFETVRWPTRPLRVSLVPSTQPDAEDRFVDALAFLARLGA